MAKSKVNQASKAKPPATKADTPSKAGSLTVDLGISKVVNIDNAGYIPSRPEITLGTRERRAIKRLAMTLDMNEAKLANGQLVKNSVQKTVAWLCERFADALEAEVPA